MRHKILLISLRLNPAFIQHLIAYAKAVQALGYEASFLLDPAYQRLPELKRTAEFIKLDQLHTLERWKSAIFMNPSLKNLGVASRLKKSGTRILYMFHEPWQLSFDYAKDEGVKAALLAALAYRFTVPVLRVADHVLLPSQYALRIYRAHDAQHNSAASFIPLLYDDELNMNMSSLVREKKFLSYIGNPCRAHGFDQFYAILRRAVEEGLDTRFLIASRHPLPSSILRDPLLQQSDRIVVKCGKLLSTEEINQCYAQSICVWNVYRRSTQSGVLPKAWMFGAPVLCSHIGSFPEFVTSGRNGEVVPANDFNCIIDAYQRFRNDSASYAAQCRSDFLDTFHYAAHLKEIGSLLR